MEQAQNEPRGLALIKKLEQQGDTKGLLDLLLPTQSVMMRRAASRSLALIASPEAVPRLAHYLDIDSDRGVRQNLARALGRLGDDNSLPALLNALQDEMPLVREEAALALSRFNSPASYEALLTALQHKEGERSWLVRRQAAEALGRLSDRRAVAALTAALRDESDRVHPAAAAALGQLGDPSAIAALKRARHQTPHRRGAECATCAAIDAALKLLEPKPPS